MKHFLRKGMNVHLSKTRQIISIFQYQASRMHEKIFSSTITNKEKDFYDFQLSPKIFSKRIRGQK